MKKSPLIILLFITISTLYSQKKLEYKFGTLASTDLLFERKQIDSTANAVVLYECGNSYFTDDNRNVIIKTTYYYKIKLFNKEGFEHATFSIPIYNNKSNSEKVVDLKGITHNNTNKTHLSKNNVYTEQQNENWKVVKFTMPNLKEESIIEVSYTLVTPFKFNLTGWEFQSDIPKVVSQYKALIPGNYFYNRKLNGYLRLTTNTSVIKKHCFSVSGYSGDANCEDVTYRMENIPAFEEEDYMTDKDNFISKIKFELAESIWFDGTKKQYTTTWDAVDKEFKTDKNIGGQLKKTKFFEDLLPLRIDTISNDLDRAKQVYKFIQQHFNWNGKYSIFKNVNVKNAIEEKTGNVGEINISLINALKAVGLNTELVLLSTRNNGFPTKIHPVISDFNYLIAKVTINNNSFLLDATEKLTPFGILPMRCLNGFGRVMDFENDSYWMDINYFQNSSMQLYGYLILNEDGSLSGKLRKAYYGYEAYKFRKKLSQLNEDEIISQFESELNDIEVSNYSIENKFDIDKPIKEFFEFTIESGENISKLYLSPYFDEKLTRNPFQQEKRLYPVDFGYPRKTVVNFTLELPDNYTIDSNPMPKNISLSEDGGYFKLNIRKYENYKINVRSSFILKKPLYFSHQYPFLKELFKEAINAQNIPIVLKKNSLN